MDLFSSGLIEDVSRKKKRQNFEPKPWMKKDHVEMVLVTDDNLRECIDHCLDSPTGYYSLDLETTGLDNRVFNGKTVCDIVGVCLSPDGKIGYYIPLRHAPGGVLSPHNVSESLFRREFMRLIDSDLIAIFHNGKFDQEFLAYNGGEPYGLWDNPKKWEDTLILAYLRNTRQRNKGLKSLSSQELGLEMFGLAEIFELNGLSLGNRSEAGFAELDPAWPGVLEYAASDALCTYLLYFKIRDEALILPSRYPDGSNHTQKLVYLIEKHCITATRWMERCGLHLDVDKVSELIRLGEKEYLDALNGIYQESKQILQRDIQPLSHYLWLERIEELNPNLKTYPSGDERNFKEMRSWARAEAERLQKDARTQGLYSHFNPSNKYKRLLSRTAPAKKFMAEYDVTSQKQLGLLLLEMGIPGLEKTATGQIQTNKKAMKKLVDQYGDKFPFLQQIKRFREVEKALGTYLEKMFDDVCDMQLCHDCMFSFRGKGACPKCNSDHVSKDHRIKVQFRGTRADTGRFTVKQGRGPDVDGCARVPMQGMPAGYDPNRPECMRRMRECFTPLHDGWYFVPIDYAGVELRIITNLSREPLWMQEYFRCSDCDHQFEKGDGKSTPPPPPPFCPSCGSDKIGDLHSLTTVKIYGDDARKKPEWKQLRQNGKGTNFSLSYGGGWRAVSRATNVGRNEAYRIKRQFDQAYTTLTSWWDHEIQFARDHGYVLTVMNRKYPLPDINHPEGGFRSKAERNATNGPIQGSSADITKLAMGMIYHDCVKKGWVHPMNPSKDKVRMVLTMHDELGFEVHPDVFTEVCERLDHIMARNAKIRGLRWPIPLLVDVEFGTSWAAEWNYSAFKYGVKDVPEELQGLIDLGDEGPAQEEEEEPAGADDVAPESSSEESSLLRYRLYAPMTVDLAERVVEVIVATRLPPEKGGQPLYLVSDVGEDLDWPGGSLYVDPSKFKKMADRMI